MGRGGEGVSTPTRAVSFPSRKFLPCQNMPCILSIESGPSCYLQHSNNDDDDDDDDDDDNNFI